MGIQDYDFNELRKVWQLRSVQSLVHVSVQIGRCKTFLFRGLNIMASIMKIILSFKISGMYSTNST